MTPGEYKGVHYEAIERGPYVFYEYSLVSSGVVSPEDGAGFNVECDGCRALREAKFTDKPWDGSASRFKDTDAYCAACLIDYNEPGEDKVQAKCKLPIKEPDGTINKNAIRNALARISQLKGVPAADLSAAKAKLAKLAKQAGIGEESASIASRSLSPAHRAVRGKAMSEGQPPATEPEIEEQLEAAQGEIDTLKKEVKTLKDGQTKITEDLAAKEKAALSDAEAKEKVEKSETDLELKQKVDQLEAMTLELKKSHDEKILAEDAERLKLRKSAFAQEIKPAYAAEIEKLWPEVESQGETRFLQTHPEMRLEKSAGRQLSGQPLAKATGDARQRMIEARNKKLGYSQ
jgi:hypothetical protein